MKFKWYDVGVVAVLVLLFLMLPVAVIGYVETQRERILVEHLKRVSDLADVLVKNSAGITAGMSAVDQAQLRYVAQQLRSQSNQYEQAVQAGR